ncbi:hypothetical protein Nepgr_009397 [Nepenthes gracilis]|uniref:Uncharacterized protein n=1 Tax=Nepenthes gracilis TaxID=150966 RepID=A0AAD3XK43_NEPGR|nr:hypothetical protein Nepgr_009397 [Nepenthes gracilis]
MKKSEDSDAANEESFKQMQRKTRWGPDLTQDASVRRGRALLISGIINTRSHQKMFQVMSFPHQTENQEKLQHLDLENRSNWYAEQFDPDLRFFSFASTEHSGL